MKRTAGMLFVVLLLLPSATNAAALYMDPAVTTISRGDALKLSVKLDTDSAADECVNAAEGVITFSGPIAPVDVSLGESIFSVWIEPPALNDAQDQITFAGGIPNGYCGRVDGDPSLTNTVFDIIVRADSTVAENGEPLTATVSFTNQTTAYLNDGLGTLAALDTFDSTITVLPTMGTSIEDPWSAEIAADTIRPQPFSIQLERNERAFSNKYYIVFNTSDKQTGIDRYEVMEETRSQFYTYSWGRADAPWTEARSPYVLADQTLNSTIRVRAIDKAGNAYVATLIPDEELRTLSFEQFLTYLLLGMLVLSLAIGSWLFIRRQTIKKRQAEIDAIESNYTSSTLE